MSKIKKNIVLSFLLFGALSANSQSFFDSRSSEQLMTETFANLDELRKLSLDELKKTNEPKEQNNKQEQNNKNKRLRQILILQQKRLEAKLEPKDIIWYLEKTQNCLEKPRVCLEPELSFDDKNQHLNNFYTWLTEDDLSLIENSLKSIPNLTWRRAKILNLIFNSLKLGIQEIDGPNDDSQTGDNYIEQIFEGAGIFSPKTELPPNRIDWAWCAAYITSIIHQAGLGFSFISLNEQINACKEADKLEHCHPVQVEFLLNWANRKTKVQNFSSQALVQAGDILVLINPKTKRASHIGFYLAKSLECEKENNFNCQIYSIEGNAGPFINDKLEDNWPEVLKIVQQENIQSSDYERLLDRLTIVKRPLSSWDYVFSL